MLVLSRRKGQVVRIGDDITVTVANIVGNVVRLGFEAPKGITVHREEIYKFLKREREQGKDVTP